MCQHVADPDNKHFDNSETLMHRRYPWEKRTLSEEFSNMLDTEIEIKPTVRRKIASDKSFTDLFLLHKYVLPLYHFEISRDMVYNILHNLSLNIVMNQLE